MPRFEDFRKSDNIDDRRADYANLGEQWEGMKTDIKNAIFGQPALAEVPPNELAKQLGIDHIGKGLHDVGRPAIEHLVEYVQDQYHLSKKIAGGLYRGIKEELSSKPPVQKFGGDLFNEFREPSQGGTGNYTGGQWDNFRRSDNVDDRRHQGKGVKQQEIELDNVLNEFLRTQPEEPIPENTVLSRQLGGSTLDVERIKQIDRKIKEIK